jgi:type III secretion protein C
MRGKMVAISRSFGGLLFAGILANAALPAHAAEPPFPNKRISLVPNQQPIADTIRDLFTQAGMPIKVSTKAEGRASARWVGTPAEIWKQIGKAYNLVAYYDGSVVRVYHASEITSRTINAADPKSVAQQAARLGLTGAGNSVKEGKGSVIASGVPAFLESIGQLASRSSAPVVASAPPAVIATPPAAVATTAHAPMASDIVSPLNKPGVGVSTAQLPPSASNAAAPYRLDYSVASRAGRGDQYEIRIYNLQYAKADDKIVNTGDGRKLFRGVASILRDQVGLAMRSTSELEDQSSPNGARRVDERGSGGAQPYPPYGYYPGGPPAEDKKEVEPRIIDGPRITVYNAGNSVYVRDLPGRMGMYDALVTSLDRPVTQVDVQVTIIDVDISRSLKLGIDWRAAFNAFGGGISINTGQSGDANIGGQFNDQGFATNTGFLNAQISALSQRGVLKIVTRTNISTPENMPGVSDARQVVPIKVQGGQFQGSSLVDYRFGIFLNVTPSVSKERSGLVTQMEIDVRDGSIGGYLPDGTPTFKNNQITTSASVRQGESYIIGGFSAETSYEGTSKIPGLGDIPIAGNLFRKKTKTNSVQERVVILTPRVLSDSPVPLAKTSAEDEDEEDADELSNRKKAKPNKKSKRTSS